MLGTFVHDKGREGAAGDAGHFAGVIADTEDEGPDQVGCNSALWICSYFFDYLRRGVKDNFEGNGCFFPFDQLESERANRTPEGKGS